MTLDGGENDFSDYQLAVTGDVFRWMLEYAALETVQRVCCRAARNRADVHSDARKGRDICSNVSGREGRAY